MNSQKNNTSVQTFCTVAVFAVFALLAVLLTASGANVYKKITDNMQANNALRSSLSYAANKVRSYDNGEGKIYIGEKDGVQVMALTEFSDSGSYITYIYYKDGSLLEYTVAADREFSADYGEEIAKLENFEMKWEEDIFNFSAQAEKGRKMSIKVRAKNPGTITATAKGGI